MEKVKIKEQVKSQKSELFLDVSKELEAEFWETAFSLNQSDELNIYDMLYFIDMMQKNGDDTSIEDVLQIWRN